LKEAPAAVTYVAGLGCTQPFYRRRPVLFLEKAGVEFLNEERPGVRLRKK